jgi:hypothetical protein
MMSEIVNELINLSVIFLYTTSVTFFLHGVYHYLKAFNINKLKNNFFYKMFFFNERQNKLYKNNYSHNFIYDPLLSLVLWFCLISYLFFPFDYFHSLIYGVITLFINFYLHAEFNYKRSKLKKNKLFLFMKKKHTICHFKNDFSEEKYKRYQHLLKLLTKK